MSLFLLLYEVIFIYLFIYFTSENPNYRHYLGVETFNYIFTQESFKEVGGFCRICIVLIIKTCLTRQSTYYYIIFVRVYALLAFLIICQQIMYIRNKGNIRVINSRRGDMIQDYSHYTFTYLYLHPKLDPTLCIWSIVLPQC